MVKKYKIKKTKKLIKLLKSSWQAFKTVEDEYYEYIQLIEKKLAKITGIKDIEIFHCDGEGVGIGNYSRTMELIRKEELEK